MQNVQSAAEIQQRVINLVELYRTKVGKESKIAKEAKADYEYWEKEDMAQVLDMYEGGCLFSGGFIYKGEHLERWAKHLSVNEQLLGHFYNEYARKDVENEILDKLLPEFYDKTIFTSEEESFMLSHFKEMVNYIIQTPCNDLKYAQRYDSKDKYLIPEEVLALIADRVRLPEKAKVYNPFTGFGQFAAIYKGRKFFCESDQFLAWQKIFFLANGIKAEIVSDDNTLTSFDASLAYIPSLPMVYETLKKECDGFTIHDEVDKGYDPSYISKVERMFDNLKDKGKMVIITRKEYFWNKKGDTPLKTFWNHLIAENGIAEIIQLPFVMHPLLDDSFVILIAEKGRKSKETTMFDARDAFKESDAKHFDEKFDLDAFSALLKNSGKDSTTGLRKITKIPTIELRADLLLPQIYVIERPSENENPRPLSDYCTFVTTIIADADIPANKESLWVKRSDLSVIYNGALDMSKLNKIGYSKEVIINSKTIDISKIAPFTDGGFRSLKYRICTYVSGQNDIVVLAPTYNGPEFTILKACNEPVAVENGLLVLQPNKGISVETILALICIPVVYRQILAYVDFSIFNHLNDIIVPTDQRIILDEIKRLNSEKEVYKTQQEKYDSMKTEYINEVRMRKHDMGQKVFDLINTEDLLRYYVENRETENDLWPQIEEQLNHFRKTINELSDMLDQLSQEERFGTPELLDLNGYFAGLQHSSNINGFKLSYLLDRDSILDLQLSRMKDMDKMDVSSIKAMPTVFMAKNDLQRVVSNVLANAQKHGFLDSNRKDYEVNIRLEFNADKGMYQIDFRNNGKPLPDGMNKMRYGIKGEKAGQTAGTGLGGSIVKSIVEHYKGDYNVFMDGDWTVIRVYLPIAI